MTAPVSTGRPGTYSIVAADPAAGEIGVAVQTHWFAVGALVPWARSGVGAVATQANVEPAFGPRGLAAMAEGHSAAGAIGRLLATDPHREVRQLAVVDVAGRVAAHTGERCMAHAGQVVGHRHACQANMMASPDVWGAMSEAFLGADGPLSRRLLEALDAGDAAGGDVRGRQSAALLVAPVRGEGWERTCDVRVDDHPEPLLELRRLVGLQEAYALAGAGDEAVAEGDHDTAADRYRRAHELAPHSAELAFWAALARVGAGETDAGAAALRAVIDEHAGWADLLRRLTPDDAPAAAQARRLLGLEAEGPAGA